MGPLLSENTHSSQEAARLFTRRTTRRKHTAVQERQITDFCIATAISEKGKGYKTTNTSDASSDSSSNPKA